MLFLNELENLKFNRIPISIPKTKNKKGLMIILDSLNTPQSKIMLSNSLLKNKMQINSYFIDYKYNFKLYNVLAKDKILTNDIYDEVKNDNILITRTPKTIEANKGYNVYLDIQKYNQFFNDYIGNRKGILALKEYNKMLDIIIDKYCVNYDDIYFMIDLQFCKYEYTKADTFSLPKASEPLQFIYLNMSRNIEEFKQLPLKFLIFNNKQS